LELWNTTCSKKGRRMAFTLREIERDGEADAVEIEC